MKITLIIIGSALVLFLIDLIFCKSYPDSGIVVGKNYSPMTTGIGTGVSSTGKPVVVTTVTPEKYTVIIKNEEGIFSCDATAEGWAAAINGNSVHFNKLKGLFTNWCYERTLQD